MATLEREAGVPEKAEGEIGMPANSREAPVQGPAQRQDLGRAQVGQIASFDVAPELLHGIEVRRIGRQALDVEPRSLPGQIGSHPSAPVSGQAIPQQDDGSAAEVPLQGAQEPDQALRGVGPGPRLKEQPAAPAVPAEGQRGGHRQPFPEGARMPQDGRVPARRPRPADDGVMGEATFVLEDEPRAAAPGVFFTCGHRVRFHCASAAASRSRAWRPGRCTDQFNARSRYQTCPG
jgi:hypothetical protein